MTDAIWPSEAREAMAHAMRQALYHGRVLGEWDDHQRAYWIAQADAALAALAPFVAAREAAAFQRGAEAMREAAVVAAEDTDPAEITNKWEEGWADAVEDIAAAIRAILIPEDKQ